MWGSVAAPPTPLSTPSLAPALWNLALPATALYAPETLPGPLGGSEHDGEARWQMRDRTIVTVAVAAVGLLLAAPAAHARDEGPLTAQEFVTKATHGSAAEVELGRTAADQGYVGMVKDFGQRMVRDHTRLNAELAALATREGCMVPTGPSDMQMMEIGELAGLGKSIFGLAYARNQVKGHEQTIALFKRAANELADPDLRLWASRTIPTLEHHLSMARDLYRDVIWRRRANLGFGGRYDPDNIYAERTPAGPRSVY